MIKKRILAALLAIAVLTLCGCQLVEDDPQHLNIYATCYPIYALASMLTTDIPDMELHCLTEPQDGCLRDYELSDRDLYLLSYSADGILCGGRGLEAYEETLKSLQQNADIGLAEVLYGMELYNGNDGDGAEDSHFDGDNPFLYLSIDGAKNILDSIYTALLSFDPAYAEMYNANLAEAQEVLDVLSTETHTIMDAFSGTNVIVMNEPLVYFAQEYDLTIEKIYPRECGDGLYDTELQKCIDALSECESRIVLIEKQAPRLLTDALRENGFTVIELDVMSTHRAGDSYIDALRENAQIASEILKECA